MVQELYDRGILHRMLGVTPQASISQKRAQEPSGARTSTAAERASVASAWGGGEENMDLGTDEEDDRQAEKDSDVEESRYKLGKRQSHPTKRRRMGNARDAHTVYTSDDDDDDEADGKDDGKTYITVYGDDEGGNTSEEDAEYNLVSRATSRPTASTVGACTDKTSTSGPALTGLSTSAS